MRIFKAVAKAEEGDKAHRVLVAMRDGPWLHVELEDGTVGWAEPNTSKATWTSDNLKAVEAPATPTRGNRAADRSPRVRLRRHPGNADAGDQIHGARSEPHRTLVHLG